MGILNLLARAVLIYALFIAVGALAISHVYGLKEVQGQMALLFCLVAGVPAAFKLARSLANS